ncbi:hypothetical protein HBH98_160680 [Parastagonospora nodorum]|nr:hypothetical protein HBH51_029800 [Parastagonospora nodorum]KAH4000474.1 hypothetical protein HBI10_102550 [Parastagonospora nodorum]KAH4026506.1 hypothetical protein HBI13_063060 [Parastagonospora nodorum]KAH4036571.1 hypothetical protein HBI09_074580 [Parastagonospora nodorum]KAH4126894.1 hypothetical protein HBH47_049630 [Parastagonospora nodorum]
MQHAREDRLDGTDPRTGVHSVELHQLLPSASSPPDIRSERASIANVSVQSVLEPTAKGPQWTPFALRWYFIMIPAGFSIMITVVISLLYWQSHKNNGLGSVDAAIPGWKFIPTLLAVIYTQLTAVIFGAVKRTEPFARMAKPEGRVPVARYTLLEKTKPWWTTLAQGFQKKRNGGSMNWVLILSCSLYILAILGISPISAALLDSKEVQQTSPAALVRLAMPAGSMLHPRAERDTYLRTMGALFQNYSTSPWVTDQHVILPFWPEDSVQPDLPWSTQSSSTGVWEADTTIFRNDFVCSRLEMSRKDIWLRHNENQSGSSEKKYVASVLLNSDGGCQFNVTVNATTDLNNFEARVWLDDDWMSWSDTKRLNFGDKYTPDPVVRLNEDCHEKEIILMSRPWWIDSRDPTSLLDNMTALAYACHSDHSMAFIPARATSTSTGLSIEFDEELFEQKRMPVPPEDFDLQEMHEIYTDLAWSKFVRQKSVFANQQAKKVFAGPGAMLGTGYNFSVPRMMADTDLPVVAARFRNRFSAEVLGASLQRTGYLAQERATGHQLQTVRKVLVSGQAVSILCALLLISFCSMVVLVWLTWADKRALRISHDPSTLLGTGIWASGNVALLRKFASLDLVTRKALKIELADRVFRSEDGRLDEHEAVGQGASKDSAAVPSPKATPALPGLQKRYLILLLAYVLGLLAGVVALYESARRSGLHQTFFTYRAEINVFGDANTISPFAIIPTVLAIVISLWWESVDTTCRTIQPYISMYHGEEARTDTVRLSYMSCFWLWASLKALRERHWLLSLVTTTTFLMQILTIAMSALFISGSGITTRSSTIPQTLELRRVPYMTKEPLMQQVFKNGTSQFYYTHHPAEDVLEDTYFSPESDWLYTAMLEAALNGPEPTWSKDDWSFIPSQLTIDTLANQHSDSHVLGLESTNTTILTPAVRARLDCSAVDWPSNVSLWLRAEDSTDKSNRGKFNSTGLKTLYFPEPAVYDNLTNTRLTAQPVFPQCCGNLTNDSGQGAQYQPSVLAYWTENWSEEATQNFTVKWIRGPASFVPYVKQTEPTLFYSEPPAIQALNCMPSIEASEAKVTVDTVSGAVQEYQILRAPSSDDVAWSDSFQWRNNSIVRFSNASNTRAQNIDVTTSYGVIFMKSLLRAASISDVGVWNVVSYNPDVESDHLEDNIFNMRDNATGLNLDFMSYAAYQQVGSDPLALLDPERLLRTSQKVFSTFFKHFSQHNVSQEYGGQVFQPVGKDLKIDPPVTTLLVQDAPWEPKPIPLAQLTPNGSVAPRFEDVVRNTSQTTTATTSTRVEVLRINPVAFWLSTGILIWLIITISIFTAVKKRYYSGMMRDVECIADVLVLIAGSDRLIAAINDRDANAMLKDSKIRTRLGWFRDPDGTMRWRIDLVDDEDVRKRPIRLGEEYIPVSGGNGRPEAHDVHGGTTAAG